MSDLNNFFFLVGQRLVDPFDGLVRDQLDLFFVKTMFVLRDHAILFKLF